MGKKTLEERQADLAKYQEILRERETTEKEERNGTEAGILASKIEPVGEEDKYGKVLKWRGASGHR